MLCAVQAYSTEEWVITSYCPCNVCCGKTDGITASGKKAELGDVACNVLPIGTQLYIPDIRHWPRGNEVIYTVTDRMNHKYDGQKRIDIYLPNHEKALEFGVQKSRVYRITTEGL